VIVHHHHHHHMQGLDLVTCSDFWVSRIDSSMSSVVNLDANLLNFSETV
jgi:hypothetical protein